MVHEVQSDFVCPKENFGINSKMFRSNALNGVEIIEFYKCEFDKWSPNESMR